VVEHLHGKEGVRGSSPRASSIKKAPEHTDPWIVEPGSRVDLDDVDPRSTPEAPGDKHETRAASKVLLEKLSELQVRLRAEAKRSLLVILQAMDGGGKDSTIRSVFRGVDPQGVRVKSFRRPSEEELGHDFLWRVHRALPGAGEIGIFNRSHYEDVVTVRVRKLVDPAVCQSRIASIIDFEKHLDRSETKVIKLFLHISHDEQAERLAKRLDRPDKRWKFDPSDMEDRKYWPDFIDAYRDAIERTSTAEAPWWIVPADRKWYRDWAVLTIITTVLEDLDLQYPEPMLEGSPVIP
jgi:PPK2 family polyphosphate:nucleotide phosphotransferase